MWVGTEFPGDTNEVLKDVQFRLYGEMLVRLYNRPRDRYLDACRLLQIETDLATRLRSMDGFDHRTLQDIHDLIAAWFRFSRDDRGQLRLGETEEAFRDRLAAEWRTFFEEEAGRLSTDDEIARAVLTAAAFGNAGRGYAAKAQLHEILKDRYSITKQQAPPTSASATGGNSANDRAACLWLDLVANLASQLQENEPFLNQEAGNLGLPPPDRLLAAFRQGNLVEHLELFKDKNPDVDLEKSSPLQLAQAMLVTAANLQ